MQNRANTGRATWPAWRLGVPPRAVVSLGEHGGLSIPRRPKQTTRAGKPSLVSGRIVTYPPRWRDLSTGSVDLSAPPIMLVRHVYPSVGLLMRRLSLGFFAAAYTIGFAQIASAAPVNSPAIWTGFYVGGNVGHSWG